METLKYPQAEISAQFSDCVQLRDIITKLEESARRDGKVVCRVTVNGLPLSEADETRLGTTGTSEITAIEVELESVEELVKGTLTSLRDYIDDIREACLEGAERFREGESRDAAVLFTNIVSSTRWLTEALVAVKANWLHYTAHLGDHSEDWVTNEAHMMATVRELLQAYESQDFVLVSDVLEYELSNSMERWLGLFDLEC